MKDKMRYVADGGMDLEVAAQYLTNYVGKAEWYNPETQSGHIMTLYSRLAHKQGSDAAKEALKRAVSCTILLPAVDRSTYVDPKNAENLLYKIPSYRQYNERDWFSLWTAVVKEDLQIIEWRNQALRLGVIDPFDHQPFCLQAYNWLYQRADDSGAITEATKEDICRRFKNLVWAYGGAVISNIFSRHDDAIKRVVNWRTGYFFERQIYKVYTQEQVLRIKKAELDKTSEKLVKKIRIEE